MHRRACSDITLAASKSVNSGTRLLKTNGNRFMVDCWYLFRVSKVQSSSLSPLPDHHACSDGCHYQTSLLSPFSCQPLTFSIWTRPTIRKQNTHKSLISSEDFYRTIFIMHQAYHDGRSWVKPQNTIILPERSLLKIQYVWETGRQARSASKYYISWHWCCLPVPRVEANTAWTASTVKHC